MPGIFDDDGYIATSLNYVHFLRGSVCDDVQVRLPLIVRADIKVLNELFKK